MCLHVMREMLYGYHSNAYNILIVAIIRGIKVIPSAP